MKKNFKKTSAGTFWLYGRHSVEEALRNSQRHKIRLIVSKESEKPLFIPQGLPTFIESKEFFDSVLPKGAVHQGIALEVKPLIPFATEDIIREADSAQRGTILILDGVTDVHNIGAIMRSGAAFGILAVIITDKNAPEENGAMARAASGALDILPLIRVTNLVRCIKQLKEAGFWVIGMDGKAEKTLSELKSNLPEKRVIIMGSEGSGMRHLTLQECDFMAKLPISEQMESLNVSVAAGISLYELCAEK